MHLFRQSYRLGLAVHSARTSLKRGDGHSAFLAKTAFASARAEKLSTFSGSPRKRVRTTGLQRLLLATNSAIGALRDPKRADLVATLGETTGRLQLQNIHEKMADNESGSRILSERPRVNQRTIDIESLLQLDSNTFGHAYGKFLDNHGFDPDDRPPVKYIEDEILAFVIARYREIHDFAHVLLELPPTVCGELALKWFEMAQTNLPMTTLSALVGPLRLSDRKEKAFIRQYMVWSSKHAASSTFLMNVYFEEMFKKDLGEVQLNILGSEALETMPRYKRLVD